MLVYDVRRTVVGRTRSHRRSLPQRCQPYQQWRALACACCWRPRQARSWSAFFLRASGLAHRTRTSRAELAPLLHLFLRGARESLLKIKREGYVNKIIERSDLPLTAAERAGTTAGLTVRFADQHTFYSFVAKICNRKAVLTEAEAEAGKMELLVYCGGDMHAAAAYGA